MPYTFKHGDRPLEGMTIQRAVGRGGFGEVYYAVADSGKQVALKYLRENPEIELRGIAHVMNLKSPHLITIYDVRHNAAGESFVIMEYVSGPSLRDLMQAEPSGLGSQKAAFFVDGVARGLAYLHERGIVHRDLKPANIFYDDGYVKIGDYGLSKHISVSRHSGQTVSVGTVHYMAPEIGSGSYTKAIDVYALGVILFELLTGRLPFTGSSMGEILMRHLSDRPDLSGIPEPFAGVIARALAKDPNDRYQDANQMADALRGCADTSESIASFDPATLPYVARDVDADTERTVTTPPPVPPPPPLDIRSDGVRPGRVSPVADKLRKKADKIGRKLEATARELERKFGGGAGGRGEWYAPPPAGGPHADRATRQSRRAQLFIILAVTAAVGVGMALLQGGKHVEEQAISLAFCIAGGTFGSLFAYFKFLRRSTARNAMLDRLSYAGMVAVGLIPAIAIAGDVGSDLQAMMIAPLAMVVCCDWTRRIEAGRQGKVSGGAAVWPAVVGLIAAAIAGAEEYMLVAAGVCATMSLLTQAGAAMWPFAARPAAPQGPRQPGPAHDHGMHQEAQRRQPAPPAAPHETRTEATRSPPDTGQALRSDAGRAFFGVLGTLALIGSLGSFFVLIFARGACSDDSAGLLFATLAGVACMPFLLTKALQRYKMPIWRGTLRMLVVSLGLCLAGGMIALLAFKHAGMPDDELAGVIFGLVAGGVLALVSLCVPGGTQRGAAPRAFSRALFGVLATLALIGSLGAFFALVIAQPGGEPGIMEPTTLVVQRDGSIEHYVTRWDRHPDTDARAGLLFATLAGLAWLPFLLTKAFQRRELPLWRGTLRMFVASLGLCLAAGMIAILSFQQPSGEELGGAIFGLVAGSVLALVALGLPGRKWLGAPPRDAHQQAGWRRAPTQHSTAEETQGETAQPASPAAEETDVPPPPPPVIIDASAPSFAGRTVNAGLSWLGTLLFLAAIGMALAHDTVADKVKQIKDEFGGTRSPEVLSLIEDIDKLAPAPWALGVGAFGSALLLLGRRGSGWAHVLRGCLGCGLGLWSLVTVLGPAASAWKTLISSNDWSTLAWGNIGAPLIMTAAPLVIALVLLIWPRKRTRDQTIVV